MRSALAMLLVAAAILIAIAPRAPPESMPGARAGAGDDGRVRAASLTAGGGILAAAAPTLAAPTHATGFEATLSDWAQREPAVAAAWALRQPDQLRLAAVSAVLIGVADDPALGTRLARWFCTEDPTFVREHGATLITVLTTRKHFTTAAAFAELGGPERAAWMTLAFQQWAQADHEAALLAAQALDDSDALAAAGAAL